MVPVLLSLATFFSTGLGGLFALRCKDRLHLIMGFTAGVLLGVVSFDILPEIISEVHESGGNALPAMIALVVGFLVFHIVEKMLLIHHAHEEHYAQHKHPQVGMLSALALAGHSFMDGVGIGLGFQVSPHVGILVAVAVIAHDFTDGMNTVALMLAHDNTTRRAKWFLLLDAVTPLLGALSTLFFRLPGHLLVLYLGAFAGFLLYIGASDILPEAHSERSSWLTILLTVAGAGFILIVTRFI
jgi:ZIP family zinc transporter